MAPKPQSLVLQKFKPVLYMFHLVVEHTCMVVVV